jgi:hypothetical protein
MIPANTMSGALHNAIKSKLNTQHFNCKNNRVIAITKYTLTLDHNTVQIKYNLFISTAEYWHKLELHV